MPKRDIKYFLTAFEFHSSSKKIFIDRFNSLDADQKFEVINLLWATWDAAVAVRIEEIKQWRKLDNEQSSEPSAVEYERLADSLLMESPFQISIYLLTRIETKLRRIYGIND